MLPCFSLKLLSWIISKISPTRGFATITSRNQWHRLSSQPFLNDISFTSPQVLNFTRTREKNLRLTCNHSTSIAILLQFYCPTYQIWSFGSCISLGGGGGGGGGGDTVLFALQNATWQRENDVYARICTWTRVLSGTACLSFSKQVFISLSPLFPVLLSISCQDMCKKKL